MSTQRRSPVAPVSAVTTAKTAVRKASPSAALPRLAGIRRRELRRALCHQRVGLPDERSLHHFPAEDDLASAAEWIGNHAAVGDRDALPPVVSVADAEAQAVAVAPHGALDYPACQLKAGPGGRADKLGGLLRLGRGAERRVDQRHG